MNDYEKYEDECKIIRETNKKLLGEFETWLKSAGLSENTISKHLSNIDFYIKAQWERSYNLTTFEL